MNQSNLIRKTLVVASLMLATGCYVEERRPVDYQQPPPPPPAEVVEVAPEPPPPPQTETVIVAPGPEYVWVRGHWEWHGAWIWVGGRWAPRPRPGAIWIEGRWGRRHGGWIWVGGHWG